MNCPICFNGFLEFVGEVNLFKENTDDVPVFQITSSTTPFKFEMYICSRDDCGHMEMRAKSTFLQQLKTDRIASYMVAGSK